MRQIIFRGKDINGDWRYGDLVHNAFDGVKTVPAAIKEGNNYPIEVLPDTVSQQWVLNGLKVFGNDLVKGYDNSDGYGQWRILKVHEIDTGFELQAFIWGVWECQSFRYEDISLCGNIFDNPELSHNIRPTKSLLPYSHDIDKKTAMKESLKIWAWLKETGVYKFYHPEWNIIKQYYTNCPLCSAFGRDDECNDCPLVQNGDPCYTIGCAFSMWVMTYKRGDDDTKKAAERVYSEIAEAYKQRYGVEYNPYVTPESVSE